MKPKRKSGILIGAGVIVAGATIATGLILGLRNNKDTAEKEKTKNIEEIKKEEKEVNQFYIDQLHEEQVRINNLKPKGAYKANSSTAPVKEEVTRIKVFNEEEAKTFGIDFSGFDTDKFEYKYYFFPHKKAIQISVKLRKEEHQKFEPRVQASNINLLIEDPNQSKKNTTKADEKKEEEKRKKEKQEALAKAQKDLDDEQNKINNLEIQKNISLLKPENETENEIFNESIAELYGLNINDFSFKKFSYIYSVKGTGITIIPKIKDYNLEKILKPKSDATTIKVKWKTRKDIKLDELNKEQERINNLESTSKALLNQPLEKDFIKNSDNRIFDEAVAASYKIDYLNFDQDKFSYTYFSEGDEGIMIVPHMKDEKNASQLLYPEIAPKVILIYWKEWYGDWVSEYKNDVQKNFQSTASWTKIDKKLKTISGSYESRNVLDIIKSGKAGIDFPETPYGLYISLLAPYGVIKGQKKVHYAGTVRNSSNHVNRIKFTITYKN